ncbi:MAG: hypothetical protein AB1442_14030 [Nitrospirota bacterium]
MKELSVLLLPTVRSFKNDLVRFNRIFYRKILFFTVTSGIFIVFISGLLSGGMTKLEDLSPEVFQFLIIKAYSLLFIIIFFLLIISGFVISLNTYYQSGALETLLTSPVRRTPLFFSRLIETHGKASWMLIVFGIPLLASLGIFYHAFFPYYLYSLLIFAVFCTIPVNIGAGLAMIFSSIANIKRVKKFLLTTGIVVIVLLITVIRISRPERFVNPELFANLTLFIGELQTPSFILFPNRWLSEVLFGFLNKNFSFNTFVFIAVLLLTSYLSTLCLLIVFKRCHHQGWRRFLEEDISMRRETETQAWVEKGPLQFMDRMLKPLDSQSGFFFRKDLLYQVREARNIQQLLIMLPLIVVYLFSISALPLNWEYYSIQLKYIISFFNLGLILIIVASLCSRIVYPALVSEGSALWIIKTSPMTARRYVLTKLLFFVLPISFVGQLLTVTSSLLIGANTTLILLKILTTEMLCLSFVSAAVAFGILDARFVSNETIQDRIKPGNTAYMLFSAFLIALTLAIEVVPVLMYFLEETKHRLVTWRVWFASGAAILILLLLNVSVAAVAVRLGRKKIEKLDVV